MAPACLRAAPSLFSRSALFDPCRVLINYCRPCLAHDFVLGIRASRTTDCADDISLDDQRITQRTVKEMLKQKSGCVVSITAALADRPIAGVNGSVSMITKGGLNSATQNLAIEYARDGIRFNAIAPRRSGHTNAQQLTRAERLFLQLRN